MRRTLSALSLLGLMASVVGHLSAQTKPDFSGRWNLESPANITGEDQIVKQDESTLSVTHISGPKHAPVVFKLDGSETRSVVTMRGEEIVTISKAVLTAENLTVTSTTTYPGGRKANEKQSKAKLRDPLSYAPPFTSFNGWEPWAHRSPDRNTP